MSAYFGYLRSGLVGVSIMVLWGVYGDLLLEDFKLVKVLRSLTLGAVWASYLYVVNKNLPLVVVALIVIFFERITTEIYKALIRNEHQAKYKIPSDLGIHLPRWIKTPIGYLTILLLAMAFTLVNFPFGKLTLTFIAMFLPAIGGMLKDAPYEGFYPLKFFRSPLVIILVAITVYIIYPNLSGKYYLASLLGGERIISEFYKKILRGNMPGKFKVDVHHPVKRGWRIKRKILLIPYIINVLFLLTLDLW